MSAMQGEQLNCRMKVIMFLCCSDNAGFDVHVEAEVDSGGVLILWILKDRLCTIVIPESFGSIRRCISCKGARLSISQVVLK